MAGGGAWSLVRRAFGSSLLGCEGLVVDLAAGLCSIVIFRNISIFNNPPICDTYMHIDVLNRYVILYQYEL